MPIVEENPANQFEKHVLEIEPVQSACDCIRKASRFAQDKEDRYRWRWIALCVSDALYSAGIAAISKGNYINAFDWSKRDFRIIHYSAKNAIENYVRISNGAIDLNSPESSEHISLAISDTEHNLCWAIETKIKSFEEVMKWLSNNNHRSLPYTRGDLQESELVISDKERDSACELYKSYRNNFIHVKPHSFFMTNEEVKNLCLPSLTIMIKVLKSGRLEPLPEEAEDFYGQVERLRSIVDTS